MKSIDILNNNGKTLNTNGSKSNHSSLLGILQWFHIGDYEQVESVLQDMSKLGISELRTGISWADYHTPQGEEWYDWLIPTLASKVNILPCFLYTPPSLGIQHKVSSPPKEPKKYADFIDIFITRHGEYFDYIELWNEPNNQSEYDFALDESWQIFANMIIGAAYWAKKLGKKTVLGGMSPIDPNWLELMGQMKVLEQIDVIGFHGFPDVFDFHLNDWKTPIHQLQNILDKYDSKAEIWITETGFSTWQYDERKQLREFIRAMEAPVARVYWYSMNDLASRYATVDGFHLDEREYHFGMKDAEGRTKLLYRSIEQYGIEKLQQAEWMANTYAPNYDSGEKATLITGGAGFIGVNLADKLLSEGKQVIVLDNLSRKGVEKNIEWLMKKHPERLKVEISDIRNPYALQKAVNEAEMVYHLCAQVAVTTSLVNPMHDFEVNAGGTFLLLEAIRKSEHCPPLVFTSTNKVYGALEHLEFIEDEKRYIPLNENIRLNGINETTNLEFHSPYGNSKGTAEQYILDYARSYGLKTVVFRMSCIYGPHQFGNEDQGWVAHFLISALKKSPLTVYGTGRQVRDILYVEDLLKAFLLARDHMKEISGQAFNIGGGADNTISLLELLEMIKEEYRFVVPVDFDQDRQGDQKYYVSNPQKFLAATGWQPETPVAKGLTQLGKWLLNNHPELINQKSTPIQYA